MVLTGGLLLTASSAIESRTLAWSIPAGNVYGRFEFSTLTGGSLTISYAANSIGTVDVYVMTEAQHTAFVGGGGLQYLASDSGASGSFTASLPSGGTYFVEFGHGLGYQSTEQYGKGHSTLRGVGTTTFLEGLAALAAGAILLAIGVRWRSRVPPELRVPTPPPVYAPPPYIPTGTPLPYVPGPPPPPLPAAVAYGALLVSVENRASAPESLQILVGGEAAATLEVAAGTTGQVNLHPRLPSAAGATLRIEALTPDGRRASQDVFVRLGAPVPVALRIG